MSEPLARYLERIGFAGTPRADLATMQGVVGQHLAAIPFENLDVQLGRPPGLDPQAIFAKLVERRRGGWCYEHNGLLGAMLEQIGFAVTRVSAGVMREQRGDDTLGTHLALVVRLERDYLVDVGFGGSLSRPLPLEEGEHDDGPFRLSLSRAGDGYWRYAERLEGEPFAFDFRAEPADEARLADRCAWQGRDPQSPFVLNLVAQRREADRHLALRGRVLTDSRPGRIDRRTLVDAGELTAVLRERFALDVPGAAALWDRIAARHAELFGEAGAG